MEQTHELMRILPLESAVDAALVPHNDSAQTLGGATPVVRAVWTLWQRYLDVVLGVVLVLAGALKGHQLLADPSVGPATGSPRELLIGAAAFELAFGCWMLAGLHRRLTRWIALAWFTSLGAVALAQALGDAPSCACFGELHTHPWLMFSFDVAAVTALGMWLPKDHSWQRHLPMTFCLSLLPAAFFCVAVATHDQQPVFAEIDLGDIAPGGQKQQAFRFRNDSGSLVEVVAIETSCPCARIQLDRINVPPGQLLTGNVTLDLRRKPDFVGDLAIEAKGVTRRGRVALPLRIRAHVHSSCQAEEGEHGKQ